MQCSLQQRGADAAARGGRTLDSILSEPTSSHPCCLKNWRARWLPPTAMILSCSLVHESSVVDLCSAAGWGGEQRGLAGRPAAASPSCAGPVLLPDRAVAGLHAAPHLTNETWTPKDRCTPAHVRQMKTPCSDNTQQAACCVVSNSTSCCWPLLLAPCSSWQRRASRLGNSRRAPRPTSGSSPDSQSRPAREGRRVVPCSARLGCFRRGRAAQDPPQSRPRAQAAAGELLAALPCSPAGCACA